MTTTVAPVRSTEPTTAEKMRGLPWAIVGGAMNTVFVQFTYFGPVFVLFLSQLSISKTQIGFLLSMFPFLGLVALFIAPNVARFGYKRTFVTFWALRTLITGFILLLPLVLAQFGLSVAVTFITIIVIGFGLCRAIGEIGNYPWSQEYVPDSIRGKFSATVNAVTSLVGIIAVAVASFILSLSNDLERFTLLFGIGVVFGLIGVWAYAHIPGGAPVTGNQARQTTRRDMIAAARDSNLLIYLAGIALLTLGTAPLYSFLPIFMLDEVGLSDSNIVLLQNAAQVGGLISVYLLGWSADRYGSKPVMLMGVVIKALLPIGWLLIPRGTDWSLGIALIIAFFQGVSGIAWVVGSGRMLFVSIVPPEKKSQYMAVYYAAIGIIGGTSQLAGGGILDATAGISGTFAGITLDPYTPLMIAGIVLPLLSVGLFRRVRGDSDVSVTEFAGMFVQGNPIYALERMMRYYRARDEKSTVVLTEKMGQAKSPLTIEELLEALADPRYNVRMEAVVSIGRTNPHPRLVNALMEMLAGSELSLSAISAWALGRMGDPSAIPALRLGLNSEYRSIRGQCARALGTLGDAESIPLLHERLRQETDRGLQMAYASALGNLQAAEAMDALFDVLREIENEGARMELALDLSRMIGEEQHFVRLLRQVREDAPTAIAQEIMQLKNTLSKAAPAELTSTLVLCSESFARESLEEGTQHLVSIIQSLPPDVYFNEVAHQLLDQCAVDLQRFGTSRTEYLILTLHALHSGIR